MLIMSISIISSNPLALVVPESDALHLETLDAGAAYTAYLHSQSGKFEERPLGEYADTISETISPNGNKYREEISNMSISGK
jgi:type I restriction enzyme S subunit